MLPEGPSEQSSGQRSSREKTARVGRESPVMVASRGREPKRVSVLAQDGGARRGGMLPEPEVTCFGGVQL